MCKVRVLQIYENSVEIISLYSVNSRCPCQPERYLVANDGLRDTRELELEADRWKVPDSVSSGSWVGEANGNGFWPEFNDAGKGTFD